MSHKEPSFNEEQVNKETWEDQLSVSTAESAVLMHHPRRRLSSELAGFAGKSVAALIWFGQCVCQTMFDKRRLW